MDEIYYDYDEMDSGGFYDEADDFFDLDEGYDEDGEAMEYFDYDEDGYEAIGDYDFDLDESYLEARRRPTRRRVRRTRTGRRRRPSSYGRGYGRRRRIPQQHTPVPASVAGNVPQYTPVGAALNSQQRAIRNVKVETRQNTIVSDDIASGLSKEYKRSKNFETALFIEAIKDDVIKTFVPDDTDPDLKQVLEKAAKIAPLIALQNSAHKGFLQQRGVWAAGVMIGLELLRRNTNDKPDLKSPGQGLGGTDKLKDDHS